jgi:hypothetical protein
LKWRKCYRLYLERQHLTEIGLKKNIEYHK